MPENQINILLTNDDGINSPGLWAAAECLSELGYVTVAAPRDQWSGAGRSHPVTSDGRIQEQKLTVHGKEWTIYSVGGSPAQTVIHALFEICHQKPDLVVSGINYGENCSSGVTASGTVGAAIEAASHGIPAMAVSLETHPKYHLSYSDEIDFAAAKHFTKYFAQKILSSRLPNDVDVLKVEVPDDATITTEWEMTRLARMAYYHLSIPPREDLNTHTHIRYRVDPEATTLEPGSDNYSLHVSRKIAVTPLSIDFTSRVNLKELEQIFR